LKIMKDTVQQGPASEIPLEPAGIHRGRRIDEVARRSPTRAAPGFYGPPLALLRTAALCQKSGGAAEDTVGFEGASAILTDLTAMFLDEHGCRISPANRGFGPHHSVDDSGAHEGASVRPGTGLALLAELHGARVGKAGHVVPRSSPTPSEIRAI